MLTTILSFCRDEGGVTPVEYGLIAAILVVAATAAVSAAGYTIHDILDSALPG